MGFSRPPLTVEQRLSALLAGFNRRDIRIFMDAVTLLKFAADGHCKSKDCNMCNHLELIMEQGLLHPTPQEQSL